MSPRRLFLVACPIPGRARLPSPIIAGIAVLPACVDPSSIAFDIGSEAEDEIVYNVVEYDAPAAEWECAHPASCVEDYLAFPEKAAAYARPISEAELEEIVAAIEAGGIEPSTEFTSHEELAADLVEALNMRFLLDGLAERDLVVARTERIFHDGHVEEHLLLTDPYVGTFPAILLVPDGGRHPAVLALHGHLETAHGMVDDRFGREYPERGFVLMAPTQRAMGADADEDRVTRALLLQGFSTLELRVYEAMLALKYLRFREDIVLGRVGLVGHSGGSAVANLLVRIDGEVSALVTDLVTDYAGIELGAEPGTYTFLDEYDPEVHVHHPVVADFQTAPAPVLSIEYDAFAENKEAIFEHFRRHLR